MTGLETKILNFIETKYNATFLGKVEVVIDGEEYCLNFTLNNYMIPMIICYQSADDDTFYTHITKELSLRDLVRVDYLKLVKTDERHSD